MYRYSCNNQRSAVKWHKKERGTQALFLNKHKLHLTQVKLGEVASATCSMEDISEILNNIEAVQKRENCVDFAER